ncbi:membrane protein insertase YidC [candidate division KSB1 bacterium]
MDKKTIIAFVIIGLVIILTPYYMDLVTPESVKRERIAQQQRLRLMQDSLAIVQQQAALERESQPVETPAAETQETVEKFSELAEGKERKIKIETPLYTAVFSSKGGTVDSWIFKKYNHRNGEPLDLIQENDGNLAISFVDPEGDNIDTKDLIYTVRGFESSEDDINIDLMDGSQNKTIEFILNLGNNRLIRKSLTFYFNSYAIDLSVKLINMDRYIDGRQYELYWGGGLAYSEIGMDDDRYAKAYILLGEDEKVDINADDDNTGKTEEYTGNTGWIAARTKYFSMAIIPKGEPGKGAFSVPYYEVADRENRWFYKHYLTGLKLDFKDDNIQEDRFQVYIGPNDFEMVKSLGVNLEMMMDFGWKFIRPISKLIYNIIVFLHGIIPNYGIAIIIFALLLKLLFHPLTAKSFKSMKAMSELQPKIKELRDKYKGEPQKLNQATMRLYKEHGVNPMGGCLPMLLQMPVFFALYPVFYTFIDFRGAKFFGWINDLSQGDTLFNLPFSIPMYGNEVNLLPLIWGASMLIQQKMTMKDPKQKAMVYIMPLMMMLFFNNFPSGLVLYWLVFNVLSIVHQKVIVTKDKDNE